MELSLLESITKLVRAGKFGKTPTPKKVVHTGHSWGSLLSNGVATFTPGLSDGIVLTGYSNLAQYMAMFVISTTYHIAAYTVPERFHGYSTGYLTWGDEYYNQYSFFKYPDFNEGVLKQAEATKQPFTIGEFISGGNTVRPAADFDKPVLVCCPLFSHHLFIVPYQAFWISSKNTYR